MRSQMIWALFFPHEPWGDVSLTHRLDWGLSSMDFWYRQDVEILSGWMLSSN